VGVHIIVTPLSSVLSSVESYHSEKIKPMVVQSLGARTCGTLIRWVEEVACRTLVQLRDVTAELAVIRAPQLSMRLAGVRWHVRVAGERAVLSWADTQLSIGDHKLLVLSDGHALVRDRPAGVDCDIHVVAPVACAPLALVPSIAVLLSTLGLRRHHFDGEPIMALPPEGPSCDYNCTEAKLNMWRPILDVEASQLGGNHVSIVAAACSLLDRIKADVFHECDSPAALRSCAQWNMASLRITFLGDVKIAINDGTDFATIIFHKLRLAYTPEWFVIKGPTIEFCASTTKGKFDGLHLSSRSALDGFEWMATMSQGTVVIYDASNCARWAFRILGALNKLFAAIQQARIMDEDPVAGLLADRGTVSVPSIRFELAWGKKTCFSVALQGATLSTVSNATGFRRIIIFAGGCLEVDGARIIIFEMDPSGTRQCLVEFLQGAPPLMASVQSRAPCVEARRKNFATLWQDCQNDDNLRGLDATPSLTALEKELMTRYIIGVPHLQYVASGEVTSMVIARLHGLLGLIGNDTLGKKSYAVTVDALECCLTAGDTSTLSMTSDFVTEKSWPRPQRNCLLIATRDITVATDGQMTHFQVACAQVSYDSRMFIHNKPGTAGCLDAHLVASMAAPDACTVHSRELKPFVTGEYVTTPVSMVSVSVLGLVWLAARPPARLVALFNKICGNLEIGAARSDGSPCCSLQTAVLNCFITLHDTTLEYMPPKALNHDFHVRLTTRDMRIASTTVSGATLVISSVIRDNVLYLNDTHDFGCNFALSDCTTQNPGDLEAFGFVQLATVDVINLTMNYDWSLPRAQVIVDGRCNTLCTYCCADSLHTLLDVLAVVEKDFVEIAAIYSRTSDSGKYLGSPLFKSSPDKSQLVTKSLTEVSDSALSGKQMHCSSSESSNDQDGGATGDARHDGQTFEYGEAAWYDGFPPKVILDHVPVSSQNGLPLAMGSEMIRINVCARETCMRFFAGFDWHKELRMHQPNKLTSAFSMVAPVTSKSSHQIHYSGRDIDKVVEVIGLHFRCQISIWASKLRFEVCAGDVIVSESVSSFEDRGLRLALTRLQCDKQHQLGTCEDLVRLLTSIDRPKTELKVKILPLRCCIDAELARYLNVFFGGIDTKASTQCWHDRAEKVSPLHYDSLEMRSKSDQAQKINLGSYFVVDMAALELKVDYRPQAVNTTRLCRGALGELFHIFALEQVQVTTRRCRVVAKTPTLAWQTLRHLWSNELSKEQMHKFVSGTSVVRPLYAMGTSLARIIHRPLEARTSKDKWRTFKRESVACGKIFTCEAARASRCLVTRVAFVLQSTADLLDGNCKRSRPCHNIRWSGSACLNLKHQSITEVASNAICHGLEDARSTIVEAFIHPSPSKFSRAMPAAILHPIAGASRGVATILLGIEQGAQALD